MTAILIHEIADVEKVKYSNSSNLYQNILFLQNVFVVKRGSLCRVHLNIASMPRDFVCQLFHFYCIISFSKTASLSY